MKISASGAYSSLSNLETLAGEEVGVESLVSPRGTKASKWKGKGKSKAYKDGNALEEKISILKFATARKLSLIEDFKTIEERKLVLKEKVVAIKEMETEMTILNADTSSMTEEQRSIHAKIVEKIKAKYF